MSFPRVSFYAPAVSNNRVNRPEKEELGCIQPDHREVPDDNFWTDISDLPSYDPDQRPRLDGLISSNAAGQVLEVYGADCAMVAVCDNSRYGLLHLPWRRLIKKGLTEFLDEFDEQTRKVIVAPFLKRLEFDRDETLAAVKAVFPEFVDDVAPLKKPMFNYKAAIAKVLEEESHVFAFEQNNTRLASRRRGIEGTNFLQIGPAAKFTANDPGKVLAWLKKD